MAGVFGGGKNTVTEADRVSEFQVNSATYGAVVPIIFGTTRISGNIIDYYNFNAISHSETTRTGKGGGGSSSTNITYSYKAAVLIGLCEGVCGSVGRVWQGNDTITTLAALGMTLFSGAYGQAPWAYTQGQLGSHALPYSGLSYVAGYIDLTSSGGMYTYNFELQGLLSDRGDGIDCNPADIVQYILTDSVNGIGISGINASALANFWTYCKAADRLGSLPLTDQSKAHEIINNLCAATNTMVFDSQGELKFVPRCEEVIAANGVTYTPDMTVQYDLDEDDFLEFDDGTLVQFEPVDESSRYNQSTVEFINRANGYETETVDQQILADVSDRGLVPMSTATYHFFHTKARAEQVAMELALRSCYTKGTVTFRLPWIFCRLEPGDIVTLSLSTGPLLLNKLPVRIESAEELGDCEFEYEAKPLLSGIASPARYTVFDSDRAARDYNVDPGNSTDPVLFELPANLGGGVAKTFIATSGGATWGGANVWLSDDGDTYAQKNTVTTPSRYGTLRSALPDSATEIDTTNTLSIDLSLSGGELISGTQADAQNKRTLCWVDGELISYATATLTGANKYSLSYLVRGCYGTPITSHAAGTSFIRVDDALVGIPYAIADIGKTIYAKLQSINIYGSGAQELSDLAVHPHTIQQYHVPQVSGLVCTQAYRETGATISYELTLAWVAPDPDVYAAADVYMRSSVVTSEEMGELTADECGDTAINRIGLDVVPWKQVGSGAVKFTYPGAVFGATYKFMVVARDGNGISADTSEAPIVEHIVVIKPYTPVTPSGLTLSVSDKCYCTWSANTDTDIDFYELRLNNNPGAADGLLFRGSALSCTPVVANRTGSLYLFAHNPSGHYSPALSYSYSFAAPVAPVITIANMFQGFVVTSQTFPARVLTLNAHINGVVYGSPNNQYRHSAQSGIFTASAAFADYFGEGVLSGEQTVTIVPTIDPALIAAESLSLAKMDATIKDAVSKAQGAVSGTTFDATVNQLTQADSTNATQITQTAGQITSVVTELGKPLDQCSYTAIAQAKSAIELRVVDTDYNGNTIVSKINLGSGTVTIDGKYVHITGDTVIDNNLIVGEMIAAGAITTEKLDADSVTAEKLSVTSLSAICATIGTLRTATTGARTEISDNLIKVYDSNNVLRVRMGVW